MRGYWGSRSARLQWGRESGGGGGIWIRGKQGIEERIGHIARWMKREGGVGRSMPQLGSERGRRRLVKCDQIREYDVLRVFCASDSEAYPTDGFRAGNERPGRGQS